MATQINFHYNSRGDLRDKVIQAFSRHEEISHIFFFGKEAGGAPDDYSDIDMVVCSDDVARTQKNYRQTFANISPIRSTWTIASSPDQFAEMIMLESYNPYQKVDFSIVGTIQEKAQFGPFKLAYARPDKSSCSVASPNVLREIPIKRDVVYTLTEALFSVARFTKCLFRKDIQMYRRWHGLMEVTMLLLFEKYFGWEIETYPRRLMSHEIADLYKVVSINDLQRMEMIGPPSGQVDIIESYQAGLDMLISLSHCKARELGYSLDAGVIAYVQDFLKREIVRYRKNRP